MAKRGVDGVRLADVAREAGISIGLIQHYFDSRVQLLAATFEAFNNAFIDNWKKSVTEHPDPVARVRMLIHLCVFERDDWRELWWPLWVEFWSISLRDDQFRAQYEDIYERWRVSIREAIQVGISEGMFTPESPVDDVVDRLTATIEGLRVQALLEPARMPRDRMFSLLLRFVEQELRCPVPGD